MTVAELITVETVKGATAQSRTPLSNMLKNMVTQGHLSCDHEPFPKRSWWIGPACRLPAGEPEPVRVRPTHVVASTASLRDPEAWRQDAPPDKPLIHRPGALDSNRLPSRRGSRLYWPDGRVTTLDGAPIDLEALA
jgi:hypothetical protein